MQIEIIDQMASRKSVKVAVKKRKPKISRTRPAKRKLKTVTAPTIFASYNEALLNSILSEKRRNKTTESALLFRSALSTLTPGMRELYHKSGISVGRLLYKIYHDKKHYVWYHEGVADLVSFFESVGFSGVTYNVFSDGIYIKFNNRDKTHMGANMHIFEAGVISGFLTAGQEQHIKVEEVSCSNNGADFCHFVTSNMPLRPREEADFPYKYDDVLDNFVKAAAQRAQGPSKILENFSEEYYALSSYVFLEQKYSEHMNRICQYIGAELNSKLKLQPKKRSAEMMEMLFEEFGMGSLKIKSLKPLDLEMHFDRLKAKKEFVDISIAFLNGLVSGLVRKGATINTKSVKRNNSYVIHVAEQKR
jgi:predicted hydrocarbon binding protein